MYECGSEFADRLVKPRADPLAKKKREHAASTIAATRTLQVKQ